MNNLITNGKLEPTLISRLTKYHPHSLTTHGSKQILCFDNGYTLYIENNTVFRLDTPDSRLFFRENNTLKRRHNLHTNSTDEYQEDGIHLRRTILKDKSEIYYHEDGIKKDYLQTKDKIRLYFCENNTSICKIIFEDELEYTPPDPICLDKARQVIKIIKLLIETELPILRTQINRGGYINELAAQTEPTLPQREGYHALYHHKYLSDDEIPEALKNIGIKIKYHFETAYPQWEENTQKITYKNENNEIFTPEIVNANAAVSGTIIDVYACCYMLKEKDYQEYCSIDRITQHRLVDSNGKIRTVDEIISDYPLRIRKTYLRFSEIKNDVWVTIHHELKHILTHLLLDHRAYASDYKKPTMPMQYLLAVENERTATFAPLVVCINRYLKKGDLRDFSAFPITYNWVVKYLKNLSDKEIIKALDSPREILNHVLKDWNVNFTESYFKQFKSTCEEEAEECLLAPDDTHNQEYKKQLKLLYTFPLYNPKTKREELRDFSSLIDTPVELSEKIYREIILPCQKKREEAKKKLYQTLAEENAAIAARQLLNILKRQTITNYLQKNNKTYITQMIKEIPTAAPVHKNISNMFINKLHHWLKQLPTISHLKEKITPSPFR